MPSHACGFQVFACFMVTSIPFAQASYLAGTRESGLLALQRYMVKAMNIGTGKAVRPLIKLNCNKHVNSSRLS